MARRRDSPPPYEIMGNLSPADELADLSAREQEAHEARAQPTGPVTWWSQSKYPIVLRVPRGYAVLVGLLLAGLMILAYLVGHSRGYSVGLQRARAERESEAAMLADLPRFIPPMVADTAPGGDDAIEYTNPPVSEGNGRDPRQVGLNYLIVARYPLDEAQRLARFLASRGVETVLDPIDNGRFYHVVVVNKGIHGNPSESDEGKAFKRQMQLIGREWKRHNNNRGDALETMYYYLHQSE
ncbi:MAG: hypothetical protein V3U29_02010 [Phycisphaeraceae bacterium]